MKTKDQLVASSGSGVGSSIGAVLDPGTAEQLDAVVYVPGLQKALKEPSKKNTKTAKPSTKETTMKTATKKTTAKKPVAKKASTPAPAPAPQSQVVATLPPTPAPAPAPQSEPENDILAGISAIDGGALMTGVNQSLAVLENDGAVNKFIEVIMAADTFAEAKTELGTAGKMAKPWADMSLDEVKQALRGWANNGEPTAKSILDMLARFDNEKIKMKIVEPLWRLVKEVVRPACQVQDYKDLMAMLEKLYDAGWADLHENRRRENVPAEAIMLAGCRQYVVSSSRLLASVGWAYVKQAEVVAKQAQRQEEQDLQGMLDQATKEFLPTEDPELQEEGKIACKLSDRHGALLEVVRMPVGPLVRIAESIGMGELPKNFMKFTDGVEKWPRNARALYHAFQAWRRIGQ